MRLTLSCIALLSLVAGSARAQFLAVEPNLPLTTDTVSVLYQPPGLSLGYCPEIAPDGLSLTGISGLPPTPNIITVFVRGAADCVGNDVGPWHLTLGRFPKGDYQVQVFEIVAETAAGRSAVMRGSADFSVGPHRGTASVPIAPRDNYTGHWTTNLQGEGVTIEHIGNTVFMTWLTYASAGGATKWYVVPGADYVLDINQLGSFVGPVYQTRGSTFMPTLPGDIGAFLDAAQVGTATLYEGNNGEAQLEIAFDGISTPLRRDLARLRF